MKKILTGIAVTCCLLSCRKQMPDLYQPEQYVLGSFSQVFESFWTGMNNNYLYWDIDTTNWDAIYRKYQPLFARLNLTDSNDVRKSYSYFKEMTAGLVDGHYALGFTDPSLKDSGNIAPAYERQKRRPDFHSPIPYDHYYKTIPANYLDDGARIGFAATADGSNYLAVSGTINNNILYLYFSGFAMKDLYKGADNDIKAVLQYFFVQLRSPDIKGVIFDVRGNEGGSLEDLDFLIGSFLDKPVHFCYTRSKSGNGRLDYTPWIKGYLTPQENNKAVTIPVVSLADLYSISMSEMMTMAIKTLPNGHFVGERTWGATSPLLGNKFLNGGQFNNKFVSVYTTSTMFKYRDGKIYEGTGFPPDIEARYNAAALSSGRDLQLEAAIGVIK